MLLAIVGVLLILSFAFPPLLPIAAILGLMVMLSGGSVDKANEQVKKETKEYNPAVAGRKNDVLWLIIIGLLATVFLLGLIGLEIPLPK